ATGLWSPSIGRGATLLSKEAAALSLASMCAWRICVSCREPSFVREYSDLLTVQGDVRMEMHQVRYFLAVARTLNFTRAAEECHVAQPSLTRAIKLLEGELGGD